MFSESQIENLKKIALEELGCNDNVEKAFEKALEKTKIPAFSEVVAQIEKSLNQKLLPPFPLELGKFECPEMQDFSEESARICEELEIPPEMLAFFKDNIVFDPALSFEEHFRNGIRMGQEFCCIEKKKH